MTSKSFLLGVTGFAATVALGFAAFNRWQDDFGLFGPNVPKRIWDLEKSSKYLLSFRYIPQNFEALLIGPSLSDRMDTRDLQGYRIYNLSMDGANATELRAASLHAIQRGNLRFIILCLDPYLTKNSGIKGAEISPKEYWGSLFSLLPLKIARAKLAVRLHPDRDMWADSTWGREQRIGTRFTWDDFVRVENEQSSAKDMNIDPAAYGHLADIIRAAHEHGIQVFAYFFPQNIWILHTAVNSGAWDRYRSQTLALFDLQRDIVWDMTAPEYDSFRRDPACYTDGHPSAAGAALIIEDIEVKLNRRLRGIESAPVFPRQGTLACLGRPGAGSGYDRFAAAPAADVPNSAAPNGDVQNAARSSAADPSPAAPGAGGSHPAGPN